MAGNNYNISGDNLPKDSGNRYMMAWYDPVNNAFALPYGYPVSGSAAGLAIGHMNNFIADVMTSTGAISSGVDLGGYTIRGLHIPQAGSATQFTFQVSASGIPYVSILSIGTNPLSASGRTDSPYALDASAMASLQSYRWVRLSAANLQTANRTIVWSVNT